MAVATSSERILGSGYLDGIEARPMAEVRLLRAECQGIETGLSYLRRVVQGHLDIVTAERDRRATGGAPVELADLVESLPAILADRTRAADSGRPPGELGTGDVPEDLAAALAVIGADGELDDPTAVADARLLELRAALADLERETSLRRRALFARLDALEGELARRYRTGEATVDALLHPE